MMVKAKAEAHMNFRTFEITTLWLARSRRRLQEPSPGLHIGACGWEAATAMIANAVAAGASSGYYYFFLHRSLQCCSNSVFRASENSPQTKPGRGWGASPTA